MTVIEKILASEQYELSRPVTIKDEKTGEDKEITVLQLPFSHLRGRDIAEAQDEFDAFSSGKIEVLDSNKGFHAYLISKMAKVPYETVLDDLAMQDFSILTLVVYRFLFAGA